MNIDPSQDEDGFTLIELLVVVIIIGILAAIAIPTFLNQRESGWHAQLVSDTRSVVLEVESNFAQNGGSYPTNQAAFDALGFRLSDAGTVFTYTVNSALSEICVVGDHPQLDAAKETAYASNAGGIQPTNVCPGFTVP